MAGLEPGGKFENFRADNFSPFCPFQAIFPQINSVLMLFQTYMKLVVLENFQRNLHHLKCLLYKAIDASSFKEMHNDSFNKLKYTFPKTSLKIYLTKIGKTRKIVHMEIFKFTTWFKSSHF